jgi:ABC-type branched-subunit amino acid transport system ATPase component
MTVIPRIYLEFLSVFALAFLIFIMLLKNGSNSEFVPTLGIFVASAFRMIPSVNRIVNSMQTIKFYTSSLDIVYDLFNKVKDKKIDFNSDNKKINGTISIEKMSYSYEDSNLNILDDINFNIKKGDFVGIIGESGSGKSTLINIISGLLLPTKGKIYIENIELNHENTKQWMQSIGYVPQNIFLTDDTIKNNIAFGVDEKNINLDKLTKALKDSRLYDFVYSLLDNINTNVGENGVKLSGGQRQRIGIARALYNDPDVLILDEATSALDTETEIKIMKEIVTLKGSRTLLIVAHRLSTLESCDYIIQVKNGKISKK